MSLDQQSEPYLFATLRSVAREFGWTITNAVCQAEYSKCARTMGWYSDSSVLNGQNHAAIGKLIEALRARWQVQPPVAVQQRISRPLARRIEVEILLTAEEASVATSALELAKPDSPNPTVSGPTGQAATTLPSTAAQTVAVALEMSEAPFLDCPKGSGCALCWPDEAEGEELEELDEF